MTDYITLMGAEDVRSAGNRMMSAVEQMSRAANNIDEALQRHQRFLDDWITRFESAVERAATTLKNSA